MSKFGKLECYIANDKDVLDNGHLVVGFDTVLNDSIFVTDIYDEKNTVVKDYATFEGNGLDFTKELYVDENVQYNVAYSADVSNENGRFDSPMVIDINFDENIEIEALTVKLQNVYYTIKIIVNDKEYEFTKTDSEVYKFNKESTDKVTIEVVEVEPFTAVKLNNILVGKFFEIEQIALNSFSLTENADITNSSINYDVLEFSFKDIYEVDTKGYDNAVFCYSSKCIDAFGDGQFDYRDYIRYFYPADVKNEKGITKITAYDDLYRCEVEDANTGDYGAYIIKNGQHREDRWLDVSDIFLKLRKKDNEYEFFYKYGYGLAYEGTPRHDTPLQFLYFPLQRDNECIGILPVGQTTIETIKQYCSLIAGGFLVRRNVGAMQVYCLKKMPFLEANWFTFTEVELESFEKLSEFELEKVVPNFSINKYQGSIFPNELKTFVDNRYGSRKTMIVYPWDIVRITFDKPLSRLIIHDLNPSPRQDFTINLFDGTSTYGWIDLQKYSTREVIFRCPEQHHIWIEYELLEEVENNNYSSKNEGITIVIDSTLNDDEISYNMITRNSQVGGLAFFADDSYTKYLTSYNYYNLLGKFKSTIFLCIGSRTRIIIDGHWYDGIITKVVQNLTGLYEYEIRYRETK